MVYLEVAAASAAGYLAAVFIALFDLAASQTANDALAVAGMLRVVIQLGEHDVDVGIAQHQ